MRVRETTSDTIQAIREMFEQRMQGVTSLDQAAQAFVSVLSEFYEESLVLGRVFIAIRYSKLPRVNQRFVSNLAQNNEVFSKLSEHTQVLSLVGTKGLEPEWNERQKSVGHVGIPLVSKEFIDSIPMLSRLFSDLGFDFHHHNEIRGMQVSVDGEISGVFYLQNAEEAIDTLERKIIPAQDFVRTHSVKTVFGVGGRYMIGDRNIVAAILFLNEQLDRSIAQRFQVLINYFKMSTLKLVSRGQIFSSSVRSWDD